MKKLKITKEQYNKLIKSGVISESANIVDKTFKKALAGKDVYNLKYMPEEKIEKAGKFNIGKPISGIRNIREEVNNLLEYIYGLTENFSNFWENYGLTYEDLCEALESKGYLIKKESAYKVSKKMGDAKSVKEGISQTLTEMLTPIEEEASNLPSGAEFDSRAPYNRPEPKIVRGERPRKRFVELKYSNPEIAIFKDLNSGEMYTFYYGDIDYRLLEPYADRYGYTDADGDLEYDDNFEIDDDILENYVNDNFEKLSKGIGVEDFESGKTELVLINEELKDELLHLYDKDSRLVMVLEPIAESTGASSSGSYTGLFSPSNASVKKDKIKLPPVVAETSTVEVGNIGYDNPGFVGISRDGKFPTNPKPTKAQKNTQFAGGAFVKFDDCTKLNNNKEAQNGGCSTGAANNVVKLVKTKSNINAPSLSESKNVTIYKLDRLVKKNKI
jgi:hypothetical protein